MADNLDRRRFLGAAVLSAAAGPHLLAQQADQKDQRTIEPEPLPLDKPAVWTLYFKYRYPKIVTVPLFNRATGRTEPRPVWYLWYQVFNTSGEPVKFLPVFDLTPRDLDAKGRPNERGLRVDGGFPDDPEPAVVDWIARTYENVTGEESLRPFTSVTISQKAIPSVEERYARRGLGGVCGIAVWTEMATRAPGTNSFSIYVTGLSNGLVKEQVRLPDGTEQTIIKRKVLKLDFFKPTDEKATQKDDIRPDDRNGMASTWVYRETPKRVVELPPKPAGGM